MSHHSDHARRLLRPSWTSIGVMIAAASVLFAACGDGGSEDSAPGSGEEQVTRGEELYQASCASCHGTDLRGTTKGPSHLSIVYEPGHHSDDAFRSAIANGVPQHHWPFGDMDAVPGLSSTEVDAIIAYVREIQQREGFEQ